MQEKDLIRYKRQLLLEEFGEEAQKKLKESTVLIIGAGGLGCPVSVYLASAGVGRIIICDKDEVELSNLNRQILHFTGDIDKPKVLSAKSKLSDLNPDIQIETHAVYVDHSNIEELAKDVDIIADCLDNVKTRMDLNNFIIKSGTPSVHAGIDRWSGQLTLIHPPNTPCLHCMFEKYVEPHGPKPVLGAFAGTIGTMQALAIIKHLTGMDSGLRNQLLLFDGLNMECHKIPVHPNENCPVCHKK